MNMTAGQNSIYRGLAFQAYMERKPGRSREENSADKERGSFLGLLKETRQKPGNDELETASEVEAAKECVKNYQTVLVKEILYGTSHEQHEKEEREHKKYRLFQSDNGVFGDKTLEEHVNPSKNPKAVWNGAESKKLTKDQIRYLKGKYNVADMSDEEFAGLIMELTDMKLLSAKEMEEVLIRKLPVQMEESGYMIMSTEAYEKWQESHDRRVYSERLLEILRQLLADDEDIPLSAENTENPVI